MNRRTISNYNTTSLGVDDYEDDHSSSTPTKPNPTIIPLETISNTPNTTPASNSNNSNSKPNSKYQKRTTYFYKSRNDILEKLPIKSILLSAFLFLFGSAGIVIGSLLLSGHIETEFWDRGYGFLPFLFIIILLNY